jgi:transposase
LLNEAAEHRAAGLSWEAVAEKVGRTEKTVRRWPEAYPEKWAEFLRKAEARLVSEATAESVHTLRKQLRSADDKASRDAAQKLIAFRVALGKKPKKPARKPARKPSTDAARLVAYLEGLSDAEFHTLAEEFDRRRADAPPAA